MAPGLNLAYPEALNKRGIPMISARKTSPGSSCNGARVSVVVQSTGNAHGRKLGDLGNIVRKDCTVPPPPPNAEALR